MKRHHARWLGVVLPIALVACEPAPDDDGAIVASGHVEATEITVSTKIGGILESVPFEEGDSVARGQELARVETIDIELALNVARAERDQAQADLALRIAGAREEDIAEAQAQVRRAEADLAEAQAQVRRAEADLSGAERDLERMEGLLASGSGTAKTRDDARTRRDVAAASLSSTHERLRQAAASLSSTHARLRRLEAGSRPEEIAGARARLAGAEAHIAQLERQIEDAVVLSPANGVVTRKLVEAGELASRGAGLAVVSNLRSAWLTAYVVGPDLARVRIGQPVEVVTDDGQARTGRLTFVASEAEFTPKNVQTRDERVTLVYRVKVALENDDGLFKPGMPAEARLLPTEVSR